MNMSRWMADVIRQRAVMAVPVMTHPGIELNGQTKDVPPTALAMGNVDPVSVFKDGTPALMRQTVTELLTKTRDYPNFVLSSGCDTPPHTPMANVDAFFEALNDFNRQ